MIDYKTIVSTTDSKVTLMQWLQALAKEFDNAKITDIAFANDGNSTLTFTFTLTDGTTKTATCKAITLTDDEKAIVSGLVGQVATSTDGITFNKAVTFVGNIVTKGNEIHQGYESHLGDESHSGTATYKGVIKTSEIDNTAGNAMLRNKDTEGAIVLGSVSKKAVIMGSGDRPTYSKDGSDFAGSELALKSDVTDLQKGEWNELYYSLGIGRWSNQEFVTLNEGEILDYLRQKYTGPLYRYACNIRWISRYAHDGMLNNIDCYTPDFGTDTFHMAEMAFARWMQNEGIILYLKSMNVNPAYMFFSSTALKKILPYEGATIKWSGYAQGIFMNCKNLEEIGAFDMSNLVQTGGGNAFWFTNCPKLKSIHCTHFYVSFGISSSTQFEEADLVEILNNLDPVSTTQTLTMGATNLAKLTSDDILIATGKGWALA